MSADKKKPTIYSTDPLAAIMELDAKLENCAASFEGRLSSASSTSNPSLEQLAADFKQFKVCMKLAIDLIRAQVSHVTSAVDEMENRNRRKFLLFRGLKETEGENLRSILSGVIVDKLQFKEFNPDSIRFCYRLGKDTSKAGKRPVLVRFQSLDVRARIWQSKKELKGADVSVAEYLTAPRRAIFNDARKFYGVHKCWSQDGSVYLLVPDGTKHRLLSQAQLKEIMQKFPPTQPRPMPGPSTTAAANRPVGSVPAAAAPTTRSRARPK